MKKQGRFILMLVLVLFISSGYSSAVSLPPNTNLSHKMAKEASTFIQDIEIFFGFVDESKDSFYSFEKESMDDYKGLLYAEFIDFDNDGVLELLCIFNQTGHYNTVNAMVLEFKGEDFYEIHNNIELTEQDPDSDIEIMFPFMQVSANHGEIGTTSLNGKPYLYYKNEDGTGQEFWLTHDFFTLKNKKWIKDTALEYSYEYEYDSNDKETKTIDYKKNGKSVKENEYKKALTDFEKNKKIILTDYEDIRRPIKFNSYEFLGFLNDKANTAFIPKKGSIAAKPTYSKVMINGKEVNFEAYNIDDYNYFKLRDLAYALNGTEKQFDVLWNDDIKAIELFSENPYNNVGGEMVIGDGKIKNAVVNKSDIYYNSKEETFLAYTINDNNYFKLRDIGKTFNFGVDWDPINNAILIDTSKGYVE